MAIKKRNKTSAQFSMSSLTDIIFLLLIFFMLTSNLVNFNAFDLPESDNKTVAPLSMTVSVTKSGEVQFNGNAVNSIKSVDRELYTALQDADNRANASVTIVAEKGVPFSKIVDIMKLANQYKCKAILATKPKS